MNHPSPQDLLEARLTAYAFNELAGQERAEVERLLAEDTAQAEAARQEIARLREIGAQLSSELARDLRAPDAPSLTPAQRAAISRAAGPARPLPFLRWSLAAACAALAAAVMVVVLVPGSGPRLQEVALANPPSEPLVRAEEADRGRELAAPSPAPAAVHQEAAKQYAQTAASASERQADGGALAKTRSGDGGEPLLRKRDAEAVALDAVAKREAGAGRPDAVGAGRNGAAVHFGPARDEKDASALAEQRAASAPAAASPLPRAAALPGSPVAKPGTALPPPSAPSGSGARAGLPAVTYATKDAAAMAASTAVGGVVTVAERELYAEQGEAGRRLEAKGADKAAAEVFGVVDEPASPPPAAMQALRVAPPAAMVGELLPTTGTGTIEIPLRPRSSTVETVRRCLDDGRLPPPALVRISDLVDAATDADEPSPGGQSAAMSIAARGCPWQPGHELVGVIITPPASASSAHGAALNIAVMIGSEQAMRSGERQDLISQGLAQLAHVLGPADRLSVVLYDDHAKPGDGQAPDRRAALLPALPALPAGTITDAKGDAAAGLALAAQALQRNHQPGALDQLVVVATEAPGRDQPEFGGRLRQLTAAGTRLQVMAIGHEHPEAGALEGLASLQRGGFAYLDTAEHAQAAFAAVAHARMAQAQEAVARVSFNVAEVAAYRLVGSQGLSSAPAADHLNEGSMIAGQAVTLLFEIARTSPPGNRTATWRLRASAADPAVLSVQLTYRLADGTPAPPITARLGMAEEMDQGGDQLALAAAAAEFGLALRYPGDRRYSWERLLASAQAKRLSATAPSRTGAWLADLIVRAAALARRDAGR